MTRSLSFVEQTFDTIERIGQFEDERLVSDEIVRSLSPTGLTRFIVTRLPQPRAKIAPYTMMRSWPDGWVSSYDRQSLYRDDPAVSQCLATLNPFVWSDLPELQPVTPRSLQVMGEAAEWGLAEGVTTPIHDVDGFQAAVSMAGERADIDPDRVKALHLLGIAAFAAADRLRRPHALAKVNRLSPREREVLLWLAAGLTQLSIAARLGISPHTVETHLRSARIKLDAANALHAVVEAIRRREIRP